MRKHILKGMLVPVLFVLFYHSLSAQTSNWDSLPWKDYADYKLLYLNKNLVTTGVLFDRVFPFSNIDVFKGSLNFTDTTNSNHFLQAYYEMYEASYNTTGKKKPGELDSLLNKNYTSNEHPIGILFYKFNTIDSLALEDDLLDTLSNGQYVDVTNPSRSPYLAQNAFAACPLIAEGEYFPTGNHRFYIDPDFFVSNEQVSIKRVEIDFGDGQGWQVMNFSNAVQQRTTGFFSLNILGPGIFQGRIRIILLTLALQELIYGNTFQIFSKPTKDPFIPTACKGQSYWIVDANQTALNQISATYNNPPIDYGGRKDSAFFFFAGNGSSCGSVIRRPVIIIDGFDPTNTRDMGTIWRDNINRPYPRSTNPDALFGDYMLNEGYDFIILNFKNGNDLLERDALTLVELIQRLNQTYGSQYLQDITVMGPSSGGLVVQYALAYMEHNNIPHRVKTFVAFDTQFQGANVPIGFQYFLQYLSKKGILYAINDTRTLLADGLFNSYVSKQMLAHHHSTNSSTPMPHAYRNQFLANLAAVGEYPQQCRKVAIINGVNTGGTNTNITPNSTMLGITVKRRGIAGLCNDLICKRIEWVCKSTSNSGSNLVNQMYTAVPILNYSLLQFPVPQNKYAGPSPLDNAPGSTFVDIFGNDPGEVNQGKFTNLLRQAMYLLTGSPLTSFNQQINRFTIVPSYHSADLRYPVKNIYSNWSNDYLCGKTPFNFVYAAPENQVHADRNNTNLQYFENEIRCNVNALPVFISDLIMPLQVCNSEVAYIEQCNNNTAYTYTWVSSNSNILQIQGTGRQVTLNRIADGVVTVSVTITGCGVNITKQKTVNVGSPIPDGIYFDPEDPLCINERYPRGVKNAYVLNPVPGTTYEWRVNNIVRGSGNPHLSIIHSNCVIGTNTVSVRSFRCGIWSAEKLATFEAEWCEPGGFRMYSVSPNPSYGNVSIESKSTKTINEIRIKDKLGNVKLSRKSVKGTKKTLLDLSLLPADIYFIEIFDGKEWHTEKVIKN